MLMPVDAGPKDQGEPRGGAGSQAPDAALADAGKDAAVNDAATGKMDPDAANPEPTSCGSVQAALAVATSSSGGTLVLSDQRSGGLAQLRGVCGGSSAERVYSYRAAEKGYLRVHVESSDATTLVYARTRCEDTSSEAFCVPAGRDTGVALARDAVAYVVVDGSADDTDGNFTLSMSFAQERGLGASCDQAGHTTYCASGLRCETMGQALGTCVPNTAPSLSSVTVERTGRAAKDLYIQVSGSDAEGDVTSLGLALKTAEGSAVLFAGRDAQGAPTEAEGIVAFDGEVTGQTQFTASFTWRGFFSRFAAVASVDAWVVDSGALASARSAAQVTQAPVLNALSACDVRELANLCDTGLLCSGSPKLCRASSAPVLDRLAYLRLPGGAAHLMLAATDADRDLVWATLAFRDAGGTAVMVDADDDGHSEDTLSFPIVQDEPATSGFFEVDLTRVANAAPRVAVTLSDWSGLHSATVVQDLIEQPERVQSAACDRRRKFDRCASGDACAGDPNATCRAASAPSYRRNAYLRSGSGVELYLEAQDVDQDVTQLKVEYLNAEGAPLALIDSNQDGQVDLSMQTADLVHLTYTSDGTFFLPVSLPSAGASKLAVTLLDAAGLSSPRVVLSLANRVQRAEAAACSVNGFDACESGTVCLDAGSGSAFTGTCTLRQSAQNAACGAASVLHAPGSLTGQTGAQSLWDPPNVCASTAGHPEAVVRLSLAQDYPALRISTDSAATHFDSVLYMLASCGSDGSPALGCNDDVDAAYGDYRSSLTLENVVAGDYLIVIDSATTNGGSFELTVEVP